MTLSDGLHYSLKEHLRWNKARLTCFVGLILALLRVQRMDLSKLAIAMDGPAKDTSRYRRLQRFFAEVTFDYDALAQMIMDWFDFNSGPFYLTLDRTNWKWGKSNLNFLVLAVVYKGAAIPLYWIVLRKQGNSNQGERMTLLLKFINQFGTSQVRAILGDREFIGKDWWAWLNRECLPFLMRMKANQHYHHQGKGKPVSTLFRDLQPGQARILRQSREVKGVLVYLSGMRLPTGELLIVASNQFIPKPIETYRVRWQIETLFQCLKGRGFNMEQTRLTEYPRTKKMVALLAIAFCWAHKTGEWRAAAVKPLRIKNHGRPEKSLFRYGLDYLSDKLMQPVMEAQETARLLSILLCPPHWIVVKKSGVNIVETPFKSVKAI